MRAPTTPMRGPTTPTSGQVLASEMYPSVTSRPLPKFGSGASYGGSRTECQEQQCAEEECDPEECGDEKRPPRDTNYTCGVDRRPLLPFMLIVSTMLAALCMMMKQRPLMGSLIGDTSFLTFLLSVLYAATLLAMAYCALSDPGQLQRHAHDRDLLLQGSIDYRKPELPPLPKRAHKAWLYALPIRRYDHYCRWLTNVIGLLNHREFILMCCGLVAIGVIGFGLDAVLLLACVSRGHWSDVFVLMLHLIYSFVVTGLGGPILRMHIGFVSRNELANEWKLNYNYVINRLRTGERVPVNDLNDNEFNERFESFEYDETRNVWDQGLVPNCVAFWCTPRWSPNQLGEF